MSVSYNIAQLVDALDQEGCSGCAEDLLCAAREQDAVKARRVVKEAIEHIEAEGYNDDQAVHHVEMLRTWLEEVSA